MNSFVLFIFFGFAVHGTAGAQTPDLRIADSLHAVGSYSEAIEYLQAIKPRSEAVHLRLAKSQEAQGDVQAALKNYKLVLDEAPDRVLTGMAYAKLLSATGEFGRADSIFSGLSRKYPRNAGFHYQLGLLKEKQNDSTAIRHFRLASLMDRNHQQALYKVAKDHLRRGRFAQAVASSRQGLETNPANVSLLSILSQAFYHQKDYQKAATFFEKLVDLGRGSEFVHTRAGFAYLQLQQYSEAISHYQRALDYEDRNPSTHHSLGKLYAHTGDFKQSEKHFLMAILQKKQLVDSEFISLGLTYKLAGDHKKQLEAFNKAVEENPGNERALYGRALAADSYYEDLKTRMNYYQAYLNRFGDTGNRDLIRLAKRRIRDLKEEQHMKQ